MPIIDAHLGGFLLLKTDKADYFFSESILKSSIITVIINE